MPGSGTIHQQIVESMLDGLWLVDDAGRTIYANHRVAELLELTDPEIAELRIADLMEQTDVPSPGADTRPDRRGLERTFRLPDGRSVPLLVSEQVLRSDEGEFVGRLHRLTDDDRRRALVDELSRSRSQLDEAQAIARIGSWEIQTEPHEVTWSRQLFELLDVDPETFTPGPEEFIGQMVEEDRPLVAHEWARLAEEPGQRVVDARVRLRDGSQRWVRTVGRVLERAADGTPLRFGGTVQDIDALKATEQRLVAAVEVNVLMQFMASAANEANTLDEALLKLRELLLADDDWLRGVTFTAGAGRLEHRKLTAEDDGPTVLERRVAELALATSDGFAIDEESAPGRLLVGFVVPIDDAESAVVVVTARDTLAHRSSIESLVAQVATQLAAVAERDVLVAELSRSRSQLAEAQRIAGVGSWEMDARPPHVSTCSDQFYAVLDVDPEVWTPGMEPFLGQLVEEDRAAVLDGYALALSEPGEHHTDVRAVMSDGSTRWLRTVGQVLEWAADGSPLRLGGTIQDIHDLKVTELQLIEAVELNTLLQFIAAAANETSTLDDALARVGELLLAHPEWETGVAFDVTETGLRFRPVGPRTDEPPTTLERAVAERVLLEPEPVFEEAAAPEAPMIGFSVRVGGRPAVVVVITNKSPFVRHEMMRSLVRQVADQLAQVADREVAAGELAAARDLAMAASTAKSDFLATMSHEIRTPLNGVIGLNELLLRTDLDDEQRQLAEAMQGAGRSLLVLISDILDFSKIEAGGLELEAVEFRPAVVVHATRELFAPMAAAKGIDLDVDIEDGVPDRLEGDPSRFGQVLSNLVANAVKFTDEGRVHVRVSATVGDDAATLRVAVRDTGIGMDDEQLGRIFQPFRQADASTTRTFGGTGLGLAIAHRLAGALGGRIGVASTPGQGSTFWFTGNFRIPAASAPPAERSPATDSEARVGGHVLVVEDNEVNQLVAVGMLKVLGYTSEVAVDGAAAAARAAGGRFDAVLMDLQMPRLDGYAATRLIRRAEPAGVRVPIIALTASATAGEQERCLAAGMDGFLAKPVGLEAMGRVLREQLTGAPAPASAQPAHVSVDAVLDTSRLEELAEMGGAAVPLIQRAIDTFVDGAATMLEVLQRSLAADDAALVRSTAHRLKGSAANLGAVRVADLAFELEERAEHGDLEGAEPLLQELAGVIQATTAALADYRFASPDEARSA
ncbi:MAG: PAS domain-containing protein [Propionibacteriales bacterium]|nr:PAS domain-containing protein [Propionibacteriales bacterium]